MTLEEAKEIEVKIANNILNNCPFSMVVNFMSTEAQRRAKEIVAESDEERLTEIKKEIEDGEAAAEKAKEEAEKALAEAPSPS